MPEIGAVHDGERASDSPTMSSAPRVCRKCGAKIFADAPEGLCTACLFESGLDLLTNASVAAGDNSGCPENIKATGSDVASYSKKKSNRPKTFADFGDYELLEEIGRGGQGVVYRARQKSLNRTVALKVIGLGQWATQAHLKRFRREAESAANLDHPCIVPIYDVGEREGSCYFSMKFIDGGQLDEVAKRTPISIRNAAELIAKLARTVHYAHEHGILHRDIKPGNILLDGKGEPQLTDFGLARLLETKSTVTHTMDVLGTPSYMAPEQAGGHNEQLTSATDVYGLGAVLYQLLTDHPPFAGGTTYETVRLVLETEPRRPRLWNPKIDRELSTICLKCLEKDPKRRYSSALALAEDLEHWLRHEPIRARHSSVFTRGKKWVLRNRTTAAFIAVVVIAFAGVLWESSRVQQDRALVRRANLSEKERVRLEAEQKKNPTAYEAYLRGRAFTFAAGTQLVESDPDGAIRSYQEAVKLDPSFAQAWARLSCAQSERYWVEALDARPARLAAAKDALDHAIALAPDLPETHLALGYYRYYGQRNFTGALAEFRRAEQDVPNDFDVTFAIATIERRLGHWEEAIAGLRRAIELAPRHVHAYDQLALTYAVLRRFPEALATADRVLAWDPANTFALILKAQVFWATGDLQAVEPLLASPGISPRVRGMQAYAGVRGMQALLQRRYAEAIQIFSDAIAADSRGRPGRRLKLLLALSQQRASDSAAARVTYQKAAQDFQRELGEVVPDSPAEAGAHAALGIAHAGLGEAPSAIAEGQKAMAIYPTSRDPMDGPDLEADMAQIYALLGDADHAIPILNRLLQIPCANGTLITITPALLRLDPVWDQIRSDPRFQELVAEKQP
jgi:serine/threonine protein kinase/Tfp pilus assembly protein PilF